MAGLSRLRSASLFSASSCPMVILDLHVGAQVLHRQPVRRQATRCATTSTSGKAPRHCASFWNTLMVSGVGAALGVALGFSGLLLHAAAAPRRLSAARLHRQPAVRRAGHRHRASACCGPMPICRCRSTARWPSSSSPTSPASCPTRRRPSAGRWCRSTRASRRRPGSAARPACGAARASCCRSSAVGAGRLLPAVHGLLPRDLLGHPALSRPRPW